MTPQALHYDNKFQQVTKTIYDAFYAQYRPATLTEYVLCQITHSVTEHLGTTAPIPDAGELAIVGRWQMRRLQLILEQEKDRGSTRVDPITLITLQELIRRDKDTQSKVELDLSTNAVVQVNRVYNTLNDHRNMGFLILHWLRKHDHMITVLDHMTTISAQYSRMLVNLLDDEYPQDRVMAVLHRFLLLTLPAALLTAIAQGKVSHDTPWEWQEPLLAQHVVEYLADNPPYEHLLEYAYDKVHSEHRTQGAQD